jgi:hypothetical protein
MASDPSLHYGRASTAPRESIPSSTVLNVVLLYQVARQNWERDEANEKNVKALEETVACVRDLVKSRESLDKVGRKLLSDCLNRYDDLE